jgi:hypothetical protein
MAPSADSLTEQARKHYESDTARWWISDDEQNWEFAADFARTRLLAEADRLEAEAAELQQGDSVCHAELCMKVRELARDLRLRAEKE